jgi:hypothetical protein
MSDENPATSTLRMVTQHMYRTEREKEFAELDRRMLAKMSDKDLAAWQAKHPEQSPQFILAQYEWNRRLTSDQIKAAVKAARWSAWFGIAGVIIGATLAKLLDVWAK